MTIDGHIYAYVWPYMCIYAHTCPYMDKYGQIWTHVWPYMIAGTGFRAPPPQWYGLAPGDHGLPPFSLIPLCFLRFSQLDLILCTDLNHE